MGTGQSTMENMGLININSYRFKINTGNTKFVYDRKRNN